MMDYINSLEQYQEKLIEILKFFDSFCRDNNIKYTVIDGTLLGAIRHKGMIPWDGDVDVALTPSELKKLKVAFEKYDGRYFLNYVPNHIYKDSNRKHDFPTLTAKLIDKKCSSGIFGIDVFTIDFLGDDYDYAKETIKLYKWFYLLMRYTTSFHLPEKYLDNSLRSKIIRLFYPLMAVFARALTPCFEKCYMSFRKKRIDSKSENSKYFTIEPYLNRFGVELNTMLNEGYCDLPFEDFHVMVAKNYDAYLIPTYGDYMKLPPIEHRIPYPSLDVLLQCMFQN